jgi:hypothetical protein
LNWSDRFLQHAKRLASEAKPFALRLGDRALQEVKQIVNLDRWASATTVADRLQAVSWPRASIAGGLITGLIAGGWLGAWLLFWPHGIQAHAPPLPTEQQIEARIEAAKALEAELSPSLAKANATVREEPAR